MVRDALDLLAEHGLVGEVENGSHFKIRFVNPHGHRCLLVVARSPGHQHAIKQNRAELRRLLRKGDQRIEGASQ
jgi:hypothetical protein